MLQAVLDSHSIASGCNGSQIAKVITNASIGQHKTTTGEICALDWDFVIDGQAWKLSQVKIGATVGAGDKATVTVSFRNEGDACENVYFFVRETAGGRSTTS